MSLKYLQTPKKSLKLNKKAYFKNRHYPLLFTELAKESGIHLGHLFDDVPDGRQRFCINATVLEFVPRDDL